MSSADDTLNEWSQGTQALTPIEPNWFTPGFAAGTDSTLVLDPYTTNYNGGTAPWTVTLTATALGANDAPTSPVPLASYATGYNFHLASASLANGDTAVLYDSANGTYPASSAVDIKVVNVDAQGNPVSAPVTLETGVSDVKQFRVSAAASGGNSYVLAYATQNQGTETVSYQGFNPDGTPIAGDSGVLDSFNSQNGESFGFGTLQTSTDPNPSYVYIRASAGGGAFANNAGLKYETVGVDGAPTSGQTFITPPYPSGATSQQLLNWTYDRITPASPGGYDLMVAMRYSYVDASGATQQAIDVQLINPQTGAAGSPYVIPVATTDSGLTETRLPNGGFALGYDDGSSQPFKVQLFDNSGQPTGSPFALPTSDANFNLTTSPTGQLVVEWPSSASGGNQLNYDIYNIGSGGTPTGSGGTPTGSGGTPTGNGGTPTGNGGTPPAPSVAFDATTAGFVNGETPILTGTVSAGATGVELYAGDPANGGQDLGAATLNGDGTWTFQSSLGAGDYAGLTVVATNAQGATASATAPYELVTGVTGAAYRAIEYDLSPDGSYGYTEYGRNGTPLVYALDNGDSTHTIFAMANRQTLASIGNDVMTGGGVSETFTFQPHAGHEEVTDFLAAGPGHDTLDLSATHFTTLTEVLRHTSMSAGSAVIHLNPQDTITLDGISKTQLKAHPHDFALA